MLLHFDFNSDIPLYQQLRNQVVIGIAEGKLSPGEKLPPVRALAEDAGINMMTVSKAYQLLKREGYITTDRRGGTVVSSPAGEKLISEESRQNMRLLVSELRLSGASLDDILGLCRTYYEEGEHDR